MKIIEEIIITPPSEKIGDIIQAKEYGIKNYSVTLRVIANDGISLEFEEVSRKEIVDKIDE